MTACLSSHRFVRKTKAQEVEGDDSIKALSERIPDLQNDNESKCSTMNTKCKAEAKYQVNVSELLSKLH